MMTFFYQTALMSWAKSFPKLFNGPGRDKLFSKKKSRRKMVFGKIEKISWWCLLFSWNFISDIFMFERAVEASVTATAVVDEKQRKLNGKKFNDDARGLVIVRAVKSRFVGRQVESRNGEKVDKFHITKIWRMNKRNKKGGGSSSGEKRFRKAHMGFICMFISLQLKKTIYFAYLLSFENNSRCFAWLWMRGRNKIWT